MNDLEERLRQRDNSDLQRTLYRNEFTSEAANLATLILGERGASIPEPMSEEVMGAEQRDILRRSNAKFLVFVVTIVGWLLYAFAFDLFAPGNGERLSNSVFYTGLALVLELGWVKLT